MTALAGPDSGDRRARAEAEAAVVLRLAARGTGTLADALEARVRDPAAHLDADGIVDVVELLAGARAEGGGRRLGPRPPGVVYTPAPLARALTGLALADDVAPRLVLDPACGAGRFLLAALRAMADRDPGGDRDPLAARRRALGRVRGVEIDPVAVRGARLALWLEVADPALDLAAVADRVLEADALALPRHALGPVDVVVGNPPFLSPLRGHTPTGPADGAGLGAYADAAVRFLAWAHDLVPTEGGRVLLVQPASTLGARDAAPVRARIDAARSLRGLWLDDGTGFDAAVHTVAPLLVRTEDPGAPPPRIRRWRGPEARPAPPAPAPWTRPGPPGAGWTALADLAVGLPATVGSHHAEGPTLAGHLSATADFRDQYYGLVGLVADLGADADLDDLPEGVAPLVTSGLIDPGSCAWGRRPVRLHRRRWDAPAVRLADLADGPLAHWARARRTPKVLVATQTRVLEAVVDETGHWLPSVPVITVTAPPERLWHAAAALCSPTASALAALRSAGTARSPGALKLRAAQVPELPAPLDDGAWDEGARLLRDAGGAVAAGPVVWRQHMDAFGRAMVAAYGRPGPEADEVLAWWTGRLPDPGR